MKVKTQGHFLEITKSVIWNVLFIQFFPPKCCVLSKVLFCFFKMFVFFWNIKCCFPHFLSPNCWWFLKMLHFVTFCFVFDSFVFQNVSGFCDMLLFWPLRATLCLFYNVILCSYHPLSLLRSEGVIEYICLQLDSGRVSAGSRARHRG